jgi:alkyl sulfatase BDS1-like metallo-beta-lactamase superfamily hydrolase
MGPEQYSGVVRQLSDDELRAGVTANRELILQEVFRAMPGQLSREAAAAEPLVVDWRITDRPEGGDDRWQVTIADGRCQVARDGDQETHATLTIGPVDFVKLVSGTATGPELFMTGRLRIEGDLLVAARLDGMFRRPGTDT